ncbi:hypothetical protein STSP2_01874 [Anaerohalosphaera lusitana]|uniref:Uncharacterized protein n=1 Tax=Anaerohalosphaera lusitana TaxID=1936003 RepID=A0A1U9NL84_9BACT|nr:hypothetical protein [Anaerohalosphaera lusitana]AQT68702.1 hypothetical protein STSP2_01874 [Anaerohalosphaera lusitana]
MSEKEKYSVSKTAKLLGFSRARFYELLDQGVFPRPFRDPANNRPYYDNELVQKCQAIKETCVDIEGRPVVFYKNKKTTTSEDSKDAKKELSNRHTEIYHIVKAMGVECSYAQFAEVCNQLLPNRGDDISRAAAIKNIYRHLCRNKKVPDNFKIIS